ELTQTWCSIDNALRVGFRGLPGGDSLAQFLVRHRGHRHKRYCPRLTVNQILHWADSHRRRTGKWPQRSSGPVLEVPGETWSAIDAALYTGGRGLRGGMSLADILNRRRGVPNPVAPPPLTVQKILLWAEAHHTLFGAWPSKDTGAIGNTGETWL